MLENIRLSLQGIWSHKMRSFLTMLGIIIGIAAIIAIVSTIQGTNEQIKQNLIGSGTNAVGISLYRGNYQVDMTYDEVPESIPLITEEVRQQILDLKEVKDVTLYTSREGYSAVYRLDSSLSGGSIVGADTHFLSVYGYQVYKGRNFDAQDYKLHRKVVLIDDTAANSLFPEDDPVGQTIEIKSEPFTVIGLIQLDDDFQPVINSEQDYYTYMDNDDAGLVVIPDAAWAIIYNFDAHQEVGIKAVSTDAMTDAGKKAADILNEAAGLSTTSSQATVTEAEMDQEGEGESSGTSNYQYKAEDLLEQAKELQNLSQSTNQMLVWIASISLLVGGIGVMNIMLVSVTERTREIGLKKAIGAQKGRILGQFLTEAAVLTSLGGIIGVALGYLLAKIIATLNGTISVISVPAVVISVVFSMLIGIIFGLLPSIKAANLKPIDALRFE